MNAAENSLSDLNAPQPKALRINDPAPDFIARTTAGPRRLDQYRGRWVILFSHPADFTPVCTSEFVDLARNAHRFEAMQCEILALSVDSLFSHLAWLTDIQRHFGVTVPFPVIEDPSMEIARAYGMIDPQSPTSATVRATYVIDPNGLIRAISWYPMNVGRSIDEMVRLVQALQAADEYKASTPAAWQPGQPLLAQTPLTLETALSAPSDAPWYYREQQS